MEPFGWDDFLNGRPEPKGSAQCPVCGRFSKIVAIKDEGAPLTAEVPMYITIVNCKQHGEQVS